MRECESAQEILYLVRSCCLVFNIHMEDDDDDERSLR